MSFWNLVIFIFFTSLTFSLTAFYLLHNKWADIEGEDCGDFLCSGRVNTHRDVTTQVEVNTPFGNSYQDEQLDKIWNPMLITKCLPGMPEIAAPCIQKSNGNSNLIFAQEVVYRPFRLAIPRFVNESNDKTQWIKEQLNLERLRISKDQLWADYPTQYGQNMVFSDAEYTGNPPPDKWTGISLMTKAVSHESFLRLKGLTTDFMSRAKPKFKILVVATSPDSWSFQHFQDRVLIMWSQVKLAIKPSVMNKVTVLSGREPQKGVNEMYSKMNVSHVHYPSDDIEKFSSEFLVFPGRTPLIHPYTTQSASLAFGIKKYWKPLSERKHVLYFARGGDRDTSELNKGRLIINESALLSAVEELLLKRGQGESLVVFYPKDFKSLPDTVEYLATNVRAIFGPHGSKFFNLRFCAPDTMVIEFMPKQRFPPCFWELARLSGQNYFVHMLDSLNSGNDMKIPNIPAVIDILDENLGKPHQVNDSVRPSYDWDIK